MPSCNQCCGKAKDNNEQGIFGGVQRQGRRPAEHISVVLADTPTCSGQLEITSPPPALTKLRLNYLDLGLGRPHQPGCVPHKGSERVGLARCCN